MGKFVHLAREFFTESEMRALFSSETYFTVSRLYDVARARGILLSGSLTRDDLVNELGRLSYSWSQFEAVVQHMNNDDLEENKGSALRIENEITYEEISAAKELLDTKRGESRREAYSIKKLTDTKAQIFVKYTDPDFTKSKGFQRQLKTSVIEIDFTKKQAEIMHGKDDRSVEIANQLLSCLRIGRKDPNELVQRTVELPEATSANDRTQFFLDLIDSVKECRVEKVKDVRLERFKIKDADPLDDEDDTELTKEEVAARRKLEKEAAGKIQTAMLHGDNVLETAFYRQLSEQGYFISFLRWEVRETGGEQRRIVLEAGFAEPRKVKRFYVDAKKFYEKDDAGDDKITAKTTKVLDKARFRRHIIDAAFALLKKQQQNKGK